MTTSRGPSYLTGREWQVVDYLGHYQKGQWVLRRRVFLSVFPPTYHLANLSVTLSRIKGKLGNEAIDRQGYQWIRLGKVGWAVLEKYPSAK